MFAPSNIIFLLHCFENGEIKMEYMTASQASKKWKISQRRVQIVCAEDRIPGVFKLGETWAIPIDVEKPVDKRKKVVKDNE